jgi:O-6-methylguanine DNA methyltransferase
MAATGRGLCWLGIHDSDAYLQAQLHADFPRAKIRRSDSAIASLAQSIISYITGASRQLTIPLDIRATPFQAIVWRELCAIPYGTTRSYGEIARRIGKPSAARAVGHANGANPVAIVIPCHRAIGADGTLTGYRWGVEYKRRLLQHERALAQGIAPLLGRAS